MSKVDRCVNCDEALAILAVRFGFAQARLLMACPNCALVPPLTARWEAGLLPRRRLPQHGNSPKIAGQSPIANLGPT